MKNREFIKGAVVLIIFNLLGKIIGAIYRIPLANMLGPVGIGKYQLIFPLYSLLLSVSISGIPVAISKMVAEYNSKKQFSNSKKLLKISLLYLFVISVVCSLVLICFSKQIASLQGNPDIYICYYALVPAIVFVGVLSVFRGYFQGNLQMFPTAVSSLIEQVAKLGFGLCFASKLMNKGVVFGVFGAILGISVSEFLAFVVLTIYYLIFKAKNKFEKSLTISNRAISKQLFSIAIPVTIGGIASPITSIIDSLLVVNLLKNTGFSAENATSLIGISSGIVEPIINIPIVIAVSISASLLPNLSKEFAKNNDENVKELIEKAFQITLCVSVAFALCFVIFGEQILNFLYSNSLAPEQLSVAIKLLFLGGINLILLSLVQVTSGILQGVGKQRISANAILVGCVVKIVSTVVFVGLRSVNIFGVMISCGVSYLVIFLINYKNIRKNTSAKITNILFNILIQECFVCLFAYFSNRLFQMALGERIALFAGGIVAVIIFVVTYYALFMLEKPKQSVSS